MEIKSVPKTHINSRLPLWWITETQQQKVEEFDRKWRCRFVTISSGWDIEREQNELIECINHLANPYVDNSPFLFETSVEKAELMGISEKALEDEVSRRHALYLKSLNRDHDENPDSICTEVSK